MKGSCLISFAAYRRLNGRIIWCAHGTSQLRTSMRRETECAELPEKEEAGQKGHMKFEDDPADRLHESRKGDHADLRILPKDGIKNLVMNPSTSVNERPPILSVNHKSYMLTRTSSRNSNGPLRHKNSTMRKSELAVNSIPRPTMPPQSIPSMPLRGFSSTKAIGRSVEDIHYSGRSSKSSNPRDESMKSMVRGTLHLPLSRGIRTIPSQVIGSVPMTAYSDGGTLDETVTNTNPTKISREQVSVKVPRVRKFRVTKTYQFTRRIFIDDPLFKKIPTNETVTHRTKQLDRHKNSDDSNIFAVSKVRLLDTTAIRKHYARRGSGTVISAQQVGLGSRKKGHNRISNKDHDEISTLIKKVLIRKHLVHDNCFLPLPACHNRAQSNSSTAAEHTEDIEALIKALLYGSNIRIRKQLSTNKWDDHSDVFPPSHMREDLDQVLRKNIESIMRETPNGQQTPVQVLSEEGAFRQHKKMQKMAKRQAMERDIEDVMGQIQDYFQRRSGTAIA